MADLENKIIERERKKWFDEKIRMISNHESEIIKQCENSADEREKAMMEIIEKKDARIKDLELEMIDVKNAHRNFDSCVAENESLITQFTTDLAASATVLQQLSGKFNGTADKIRALSARVDKGNRKLINNGMTV